MDANSQSNIKEDSGAKSEQSARFEEEIAHCREELRLKTRRLNEFLAYLEQKLRTPLTAIMGFAGHARGRTASARPAERGYDAHTCGCHQRRCDRESSRTAPFRRGAKLRHETFQHSTIPLRS